MTRNKITACVCERREKEPKVKGQVLSNNEEGANMQVDADASLVKMENPVGQR